MDVVHNSKLRNSVQKFIADFQANRYLQSITKGLAATMPIMIIGSFAELLADMQLGDYQKWIAPIKAYLEIPVNFTINIVAIYAVCGIAYSLAKSFEKKWIASSHNCITFFLNYYSNGQF